MASRFIVALLPIWLTGCVCSTGSVCLECPPPAVCMPPIPHHATPAIPYTAPSPTLPSDPTVECDDPVQVMREVLTYENGRVIKRYVPETICRTRSHSPTSQISVHANTTLSTNDVRPDPQGINGVKLLNALSAAVRRIGHTVNTTDYAATVKQNVVTLYAESSEGPTETIHRITATIENTNNSISVDVHSFMRVCNRSGECTTVRPPPPTAETFLDDIRASLRQGALYYLDDIRRLSQHGAGLHVQ